MVAKRERWAKPDVKKIETDLQATDEVVRSHGVRGLCPCHGARDVLEQKVDVLMRSLRDPSRLVRRMALHVFDDAAVMQSNEELKYYLEPGEEKIGEKRFHSRPLERRLEARAIRKLERRKKRNRSSHRQYS
ncbi:MAG TPA: hypothetical protein VGP85_11115 [Pyrinomonadaceae bacterium]|jgi:hypothetical protein|nr:hypothetical protein [Pyrinomonadaceae bacterium]